MQAPNYLHPEGLCADARCAYERQRAAVQAVRRSPNYSAVMAGIQAVTTRPRDTKTGEVSMYEAHTSNLISHLILKVHALSAIPHFQREEPEPQAMLAEIRAIGMTAAAFNGFEGMEAIHDAAEEATGWRNEIGGALNWIWDGIGEWRA